MAVDLQERYDHFKYVMPDASSQPSGPARSWHDGSRVWGFCPIHELRDGRPHRRRSLSVDPTHGLICHAGCTQGESFKMVAELLDHGQWEGTLSNWKSIVSASYPGPELDWNLVDTYEYTLIRNVGEQFAGTIFEKARFESGEPDERGKRIKRFAWRKKGEDKWYGYKKYGIELWDFRLLGIDDILANPTEKVIVVEGEKAYKALKSHGLFAVCGAWSSGTKSFGDNAVWQELEGRDIWIWCDNDGPGKIYGKAVFKALQSIARSRNWVPSGLVSQEGGDAYDFFEKGRDPSEIFAMPNRPLVEVIRNDTFKVTEPSNLGPISLTFRKLAPDARSMRCELETQIGTSYRDDEVPLFASIDLFDLNKMDAYIRRAERMFGAEVDWLKITNDAVSRVVREYRSIDTHVDTFSIPDPGEMRYHVGTTNCGLIPYGEPTVIFGTGGSAKSYIAYTMAVASALGIDWAGYDTKTGQGNSLVINYETSDGMYRRRIRRIAQGFGLEDILPGIIQYEREYRPLSQRIEKYQEIIQKEAITLVLIDSAVPALGGDPNESKVVNEYFSAIAQLGCTTITIAHVSKQSDNQYPFGSIFMHNLARSTFWAKKTGEDDSTTRTQLINRKFNEGQLLMPISLSARFAGNNGPMWIEKNEAIQPDDAEAKIVNVLARSKNPLVAETELLKWLTMNAGLSKTKVENVLENGNEFLFVRRVNGDGEVCWGLMAREDAHSTV